jgi:high-affinity nickel permease
MGTQRRAACGGYHASSVQSSTEVESNTLERGDKAARMFGIVGLGFLLRMQHALEADHVATVSSIAARGRDVADIVQHGLT